MPVQDEIGSTLISVDDLEVQPQAHKNNRQQTSPTHTSPRCGTRRYNQTSAVPSSAQLNVIHWRVNCIGKMSVMKNSAAPPNQANCAVRIDSVHRLKFHHAEKTQQRRNGVHQREQTRIIHWHEHMAHQKK